METDLEPNNDTMFDNPRDSTEDHKVDVQQHQLPTNNADFNSPLELYNNNFPKVAMDSIENLSMGAIFALRNIEFRNGQIMLTNGNMVSDGRAKSSRFASIRS